MSPPSTEQFRDLLRGLTLSPSSLPAAPSLLELWRKSLDFDLAASLRLNRLRSAIDGLFKIWQETIAKDDDELAGELADVMTIGLWSTIDHLSEHPEPEIIRLGLRTLLKLLEHGIRSKSIKEGDNAIEEFFCNYYIHSSDVLTANDVSLTEKQHVLEVYVQAIASSPGLAVTHGDFSRLCRIEAYSVLFDIVSQRAIALYDIGQIPRARSALESQESALSVAIGLEEQFELDMKPINSPGKRGKAVKALLRGLKVHGEVYGIDGGYGYAAGRIRVTRADYHAYAVKCKAKVLIAQGDKLFKDALESDGERMIGLALLAQDDYRAAHRAVQEQEWDIEGMALTRLARYYSKIIKLPHNAHQLYLNAVQLAVSQSSKIPKTEWYKTASAEVQAYRDKIHAEDASKWENARAEILEKIKKDLLKLEDHTSDSTADFIKFVWEAYPPKSAGSKDLPADLTVPVDEAQKQKDTNAKPKVSKKAMIKVIARYHPDKHQHAWGDEWKALSEEICKHLNRRFEAVKCSDVL